MKTRGQIALMIIGGASLLSVFLVGHWMHREATFLEAVHMAGAKPHSQARLAKPGDSTEAKEPKEPVLVAPTEPESARPNLVENISFRERIPFSRRFPESLTAEFDELSRSAEDGDPDSAFILYRGLNRCRNHIFRTDEQLEEAITKMRLTGSIVIRRNGVESKQMVDPVSMEGMLRETHKFCFGLSLAQIDATDEWLILSAELGNVKSQMQLGMENFASEKGRVYLNMAWQQGNIDALGWLAKSHAESGDKLTAYAYQLAYAQLSAKEFQMHGADQSPISARWMAADRRTLSDMEVGLTAVERRRAYAVANRLLRSNESCCVLRGPGRRH